MIGRNRNEIWGRTFLDELVRSGVGEVCLAPGSRSTPLVLAAAERPELRLHPFLDERSAAFFALGVGRASGTPAAVITTSGTAVANLFPAVVEAFRAEVPLLLLTADRPPHLRGSDANQTVDQVRIFGGHVRSFVDLGRPEISDGALRHLRVAAGRAVAAARGLPAGPVHVNFAFEKPLEPAPVPGDVPEALGRSDPEGVAGRLAGGALTRFPLRMPCPSDEEVGSLVGALREAERPLIVAGPAPDPLRRGPLLRRVASASRVPLLADPLSGARAGGAEGLPLVVHHDLFLRDPGVRTRLEPDLVLRVGGAPTSSALLELLEGSRAARQIVVDAGEAWKDHLSVATDYVQAGADETLARVAAALEPEGEGDSGREEGVRPPDRNAWGGIAGHEPSWSSLWNELDAIAAATLEEELRGPFFEGVILHEVVRGLPAEACLFVSSSMPVRDLDAYGGAAVGTGAVYGNRGASGIDGIVSSALGVSAARDGLVVAVLGDVAFHHDMNGLVAARRVGLRVVFVVIHNDGGGIFQMLPIRDHEPAFTPYFATPHGLDFRHAAALYSLPYRRVEGRAPRAAGGERGALGEALGWAFGEEGSVIVEVRTDREENRLRQEEVRARVVEGVRRRLESSGRESDE